MDYEVIRVAFAISLAPRPLARDIFTMPLLPPRPAVVIWVWKVWFRLDTVVLELLHRVVDVVAILSGQVSDSSGLRWQ